MKYKKIMLVALVLLAILTIGAVSAADSSDSNSLTVDNGGVDDSIASPVNDVDLLSYDGDDPYVGDGNGTTTNDDVTPADDDPEEDDEGDNDEEESFEVWVDDNPQGFDVSSSDLSGYFIGSLTVPENMNGNISIITENDDVLFNKNLNDFDSKLIRDNITYDLTLSDNGSYIFEGVEDGTVFRFAFLDDEGSEIWGSSNYKLVIEDNTIWLKELNDDDESNPDDEFDPTKFSIDRRDDENNVLALNVPVFSLYCPDGSEGTVDVTVSYNGNDYSVSRNISDMDENNFIHWYLSDLNMTLLVKYEITVDVNDGEFESHFDAYVHDPILFFAEKSYINTLGRDSFVCFEAPSEYGDATVIVEVDGMIFNKTLSEFEYADDTNDDYYWFHPSYGPGPGDERYKHYVVYNGVFNGLEAKAYNVTARFILVNSPVGNRTFIKSGTIDVLDGGVVENNGVAMEVDHEGRYGVGNEYECLVVISAPDGANGKVTVTLDGNVIFENNLDQLDKDEYYFVRPSNLELDEGEYNLTFAYFEDDEKIVETNGTFTFIRYEDGGDDGDDGVVIWVNEGDVKEFDLNNDDDLDSAFAYLSVSNDLDGTIVLYYFNEEDDEEQDFFHIDLANVSNKYPDEERDAFTIYELSFNSLGGQFDTLKEVGWFKIAFVSNYGEDESREVDSREYNIEHDDEANVIKFWQASGGEDDEPVLDEIEFNFIEDEEELIFERTNNTHIANLLIPDLEEFEGAVVKITVRKNDKAVQLISTSDIEFENLPAAHRYPICIDLTKFDDMDQMDIQVDCFDKDGSLWEFTVEVKGDTVILHPAPEEDYYVFYGNITTGDLNRHDLMGPHPNDRFFSVTIPDSNITEGTVVVSYGESVIEYSFANCSHDKYENIYWVNLDDFDLMTLPENEIITFTFSYADKSLTFKRIRQGDYLYVVLTPDDFDWKGWNNFKFEISDEAYGDDGSVGRIIGNSNMQSIYIEFNGGYFDVYVNDTKIEGLNTVLSLENLRNSIDDGGVDLTFSMLNITKSGQYNIKIVHVQSANEDEGEYFYVAETELVNKNILVDFGDIEENSTVEIGDIEFTYNQTGSTKVTLTGASDIIASVVDHDEAKVTFSDGKLTVSGLDAGEYKLNVTTVPDEGFTATTKLVNVTVNKADVNLTVEVNNTSVGQNAVVHIRAYGWFGSAVTIKYGGKYYTAIVVSGGALYEILVEKPGLQTVTVQFEGDKNYNAAQANATFNVAKLTPEIVITSGEAIEGSDLDVTVEVNDDATGSVTVNGANVTLKDGKAITTIKNLVAGDLNITVLYSGDDRYVNASESRKVTVKAKMDAGLTVSADNIEAGQIAVVNIEINANVTGKVTVNGNEVEIINGKGLYNLSDLNAGEHNVTVVFEGDKYFKADEKTASFIVSKSTPTIEITVGEAIEGSDLKVTVTIEDATGNVTVNGNTVALANGEAIATIENLAAGELNITAVYSGDDRYVNASESRKVTVKAKMDAGLKVSADNIEAGQIAVVSIEINANVTGKVTVNGNVVDIINGKGSYNLSDLNAGEHNVTVVFEGDKYFKADEKTASFNVTAKSLPVDPALTIKVNDIYEGAKAVISITTNATFSGKVLVQIGNKNYTVAVTNGAGSLSVSGLAIGTHTAIATFPAASPFDSSTESTTFAVNAKVKTSITASAIKTTYATSKKLVVTLKDANGNLLKGQKVIVVLNKAKRTLTTNNKGQAKLAIGTKLIPNKYTASITFNGDAKYAKSTKSVKVVVNKAKPKLAASKKTFKVKNPKKYTIALKTDKGKALNKAKVTLTVKVNGKTVKITGTTKNGKATFNLNKLSKNGKYTAIVKFAGNKYYKAVTKKAIITVN